MARSSFVIPNELKICIELQEKMQQPVYQEEQLVVYLFLHFGSEVSFPRRRESMEILDSGSSLYST